MKPPSISVLGIVILSTIASPALSLSLNRSASIEVTFEEQKDELSESERDRIRQIVEQVRAEDWCPLERVIVVGHASPTEGTPDQAFALSSERIENVIGVLQSFGVPKRSTYGEAKGIDHRQNMEAPPTARVEIEFVGMTQHPECRTPKAAGGFRAR